MFPLYSVFYTLSVPFEVSVGDLPPFRRYKMKIPAGAFVAGTETAQGSNAGPAAEYDQAPQPTPF